MQRLVACVLLGCHVLCAFWPCGCRCGCKTTHDTSTRKRVKPIVDRSNSSPFIFIAFGAVGVFIISSVLGLQIQIGSKPLLCATFRKIILQEKLLYDECV